MNTETSVRETCIYLAGTVVVMISLHTLANTMFDCCYVVTFALVNKYFIAVYRVSPLQVGIHDVQKYFVAYVLCSVCVIMSYCSFTVAHADNMYMLAPQLYGVKI